MTLNRLLCGMALCAACVGCMSDPYESNWWGQAPLGVLLYDRNDGFIVAFLE